MMERMARAFSTPKAWPMVLSDGITIQSLSCFLFPIPYRHLDDIPSIDTMSTDIERKLANIF